MIEYNEEIDNIEENEIIDEPKEVHSNQENLIKVKFLTNYSIIDKDQNHIFKKNETIKIKKEELNYIINRFNIKYKVM